MIVTACEAQPELPQTRQGGHTVLELPATPLPGNVTPVPLGVLQGHAVPVGQAGGAGLWLRRLWRQCCKRSRVEEGLNSGWPKSQLPTLGAPSPPLPAVTVLGSPTRLLRCQELLQAHLQPEISTSRRHPSTAGLQKALGNLLVEAKSTPTEHKRQRLGPQGGVSATGDGTWRQLFRLQLLQLQKHLQKKHGEVRAQLWAAGREEPVRSAWAPRPGRQRGQHRARGTDPRASRTWRQAAGGEGGRKSLPGPEGGGCCSRPAVIPSPDAGAGTAG